MRMGAPFFPLETTRSERESELGPFSSRTHSRGSAALQTPWARARPARAPQAFLLAASSARERALALSREIEMSQRSSGVFTPGRLP